MEFDHIKVNHDSTIPMTGYEVTRLDAFEKGMVSFAVVDYFQIVYICMCVLVSICVCVSVCLCVMRITVCVSL